MVKLFDTQHLDERLMKTLSDNEAAWIYNGLDCCVTAEIRNVLHEQLEESPDNVRETYEVALAKHAPIMQMSLQGIRIDEAARLETIQRLSNQFNEINAKFQHILEAQQSRGLTFSRRNPFQVARAYVPVLIPLIISALRSVDSLALALQSRGFRVGQRRTNRHVLRMHARDWWILLATVLAPLPRCGR